ncbi:outer membrane beta-barrel protein [Hoylesella nanceiensis]|uniref:outer membrane beta-barrel protein n=1 Tax=Hoylesella nanceiensis TaxID=425941 RepID=UPI0003745D63|nr:outer membrane beta-barrel protein [Hoylesella nanceiensis]
MNQLTKKRNILLLLFSLLAFCNLQAQTKQQVYVELLGASTTVGVHYDSRFGKNSHWGFRAGLAFTSTDNQDFMECDPLKTRGVTLPVGINYLIGKNKHFAELGLGVSFGSYQCTLRKEEKLFKKNLTGSFLFLDMGYRYQPAKGVSVRLGLNPGLALNYKETAREDNNTINRSAVIYPYLSIGLSL